MELVQEKAYVYTLQQVGAGDSRFMDIFKSLCNVDNQQGEKFWNIPLSRTYEKRKHNFFLVTSSINRQQRRWHMM